MLIKRDICSKIGKCGCGENHNLRRGEPKVAQKGIYFFSLPFLFVRTQLPAGTNSLAEAAGAILGSAERRSTPVPSQRGQDKLIFKLLTAAFNVQGLRYAAEEHLHLRGMLTLSGGTLCSSAELAELRWGFSFALAQARIIYPPP